MRATTIVKRQTIERFIDIAIACCIKMGPTVLYAIDF
jgi:hypothetical protein